MPRIKDIPGPYRVFFTSFDCNEPAHAHVERENRTGKFWLEPIKLARNRPRFWRHGMNTAANTEPRIQHVRVTEDEIIAHLADGRVISVPLAWSWRLSEATPQQRAHFRLIGSGQGVHWPDVDEDISVEGLLQGVPAHRPRSMAAPKRGSPPRDQGPPNKRIQPTRVKRRVRAGARRARG